ncbi:phosphotransferase [Amycolatopsis sp.]|uniref:phosphotransferase n=1 Tax=Amycolatopsis sp. TaxID=37632 RepID=UPI002D808FE0|nr:phosphotransferase [Amycolatopsis sp.]HET6707910.1 phosphotransferase [Amycolatopsis sp.]
MSFAERLLAESGLAAAHEPVDVALVNALVARHYAIDGELERVATEKDDTFRLRTGAGNYLVKVSAPDEPVTTVALQTAVLRFLEDTARELPIQRVKVSVDGADHVLLAARDGGTRVLRVLGYVDGEVLARTTAEPAQLARAGEVLARVDGALAAFTHPADRRRLVWDIRHFHRLTGLAEDVPDPGHHRLARAVFALFEAAVVPAFDHLETQVIHGDFSPHNIVVDRWHDEFVTGVIDFGDTLRSAVIFDPAVTLANLLGRTPGSPWREACAFAAGYTGVRPIREAELPLLPVAALARLTLRALLAGWRARRVPDRRDYLFEHAKDDWLNVERALAVPLDDVVAHLTKGNQP